MKRTALISLATLCVLGLSACAGTPPTTEATAQPQPTAQAEPATAAPTEAPAPTETATQAPATVEGPTQVQIQLADNTIVSSLTTFKAGTAYTFAISNSGRHEHNFTISPPVAVAGGYSEALAQALLVVDETQIPPGNEAATSGGGCG